LVMAPMRLVAATFALAGFAVAVVAGLGAGNAPTRVLGAALVCMLICHVVGLALGAIGERVINEHLESYRAGKPVAPIRPMPAPERQAGGGGRA
jgi:hypothetical protein